MGRRQSALGHALIPTSFSEFYRNKRILITGHTGFKGGWMTIWLRMMGAEVCGVSLPPETTPNLFSVAGVDAGVLSVMRDIRDLGAMVSIFDAFKPEIVIHNAAQALVRRSYRDPVETYATNVMGTVHLLEAVRRTPSVRALVVVTSDKCYENVETSRGYQEGDAMGGFDPYSSSKGAAELVTAAYRRSFFSQQDSTAVASARAGNVIGGGDWSEDRLVPDMVRGITGDQPIILRRPDSVRPWQHVLEPVRGYLMLALNLCEQGHEYAGPWNFGPSSRDAVAVVDLARRVIATWGKGELKVQPDPKDPHEAMYLRLDCRKAEEGLGWKPRLAFEEAVDWTVEWYREFYQSPDAARKLTETHI
ncbi:MAG TPA: CDP-glucose 4,6-dehydratase, partial [Candidatus Angelobacter sp.]|nr:CDP-glucose 4,6-dehydratase [Candidatus Angelobacter sp.]